MTQFDLDFSTNHKFKICQWLKIFQLYVHIEIVVFMVAVLMPNITTKHAFLRLLPIQTSILLLFFALSKMFQKHLLVTIIKYTLQLIVHNNRNIQ